MASRNIVIIGGGIIGSCTAYYLSRHPEFGRDVSVHILEACEIAAGASGKAGGFMASDWHGSHLLPLADLSVHLHKELADEHDGAKLWGYRRVKAVSLSVTHSNRRTKSIPEVEWMDKVSKTQLIGSENTCAQVTPAEFTRSIAKLAEGNGVGVTIASATDLEYEVDQVTLKAVIAKAPDGRTIKLSATDVVLAAGPWTAKLAEKLLGNEKAGAALDIEPSGCSTSVIFRPSIPITSHVFFTELVLPSGQHVSPELYCRPDGTIYMCGDHSDPLRSRPLPEKASDVTPSSHAVQNQTTRLHYLSEKLNDAKLEVQQACYRPESKRSKPIIGSIGQGIWLASGHSVWGICNGPGTGKCLAELILDGKVTSADIDSLKP